MQTKEPQEEYPVIRRRLKGSMHCNGRVDGLLYMDTVVDKWIIATEIHVFNILSDSLDLELLEIVG